MNSLSLLSPAGLLALAALAVPVIIHLLSRSRGRRVPVGNIALYRQAQQQRILEPRPVQWLLLLLRLLLLALVALLLAGLVRPGLETVAGNTAYVTPEWLAATDDPANALTSFEQSFMLADGYPAIGRDNGQPPAMPPGAPDVDPWSLLAERLTTVRHDGDIHVFALASAGQFPANAPALPSPVVWHLDDAPGTGRSVPGLKVRLLHAPDRALDAERLAAALAAVATHRRVNLAVTRNLTNEVRQPVPPYEARTLHDARQAIIWLGDGPAPPDLDAAVVLEDHPPGSGLPVTVQLPASPTLRFLARPAAAPEGDVRWRADDGSPVLVAQGHRGAVRLHYLDRLSGDPDGPVLLEAFPDALLRLLLGETLWATGSDRAPADPTAVTARLGPPGELPHRPLAPWLALAAALLFALERWFSEHPRRGAGTTRQ